jgi:hypothetical protein
MVNVFQAVQASRHDVVHDVVFGGDRVETLATSRTFSSSATVL